MIAALFSIISRPGRFQAHGDDWPKWQRRLYPFTYETDAADVSRRQVALRGELASARALLWRCLKARAADPGIRHLIAHQRASIDRGERYIRNGETALKLIESARLKVAA